MVYGVNITIKPYLRYRMQVYAILNIALLDFIKNSDSEFINHQY
jgi:hypothetical protein